MGLRILACLLVIQALSFDLATSSDVRYRRQASSDPKAYQPPISFGGPSIPVASSATIQNSYQPPISLIRSNEYQPSLNAPQNHYPENIGRSFQSSGSQSYVLPNQPQHQSHSVQYNPPTNPHQSFSSFQQSAPNSFLQPATSYSVQQQPLHKNQGQPSYAILSDNSGLPQSTLERTYSTHSKVVAHVPAQSIHKTPASEIAPEKSSAAKDKKDNKNDEYVVYYYYYYDNETATNNNLTLNFDDIPSLESYDNDKLKKEPEKSASARSISNINSLSTNQAKPDRNQPSETSSSQPRSVGSVYTSPDRPSNSALDEILVQPLKPVSNVFRYGSNEVPRFPVLPNFIVTEVPTTTKPDLFTSDTLTEFPTTQSSQANAQPDLKSNVDEDDEINNVVDHKSEFKSIDDKALEEEPITTTTTEPPTTTEEPTTTTERSRRRPSISGGRRRFNSNPSSSSSSSFSPSRTRQTGSRSTSSTSSTTTTTTTTSSPTRRSFQGNRVRSRQPVSGNRPRTSSRIPDNEVRESRTTEAPTVSSTSASRSRFTSSSAPRRFQSSRARITAPPPPSSTSTTTRATASAVSSRSRGPTSRPRPNLISRNRPARPGFPRTRPGSEPEEPEPTTTPTPSEETSPETVAEESPSTDEESNETEDNETSDEETEEPTTTEASRFSALFRPRNRNALGNRPRPVVGNRPPRS